MSMSLLRRRMLRHTACAERNEPRKPLQPVQRPQARKQRRNVVHDALFIDEIFRMIATCLRGDSASLLSLSLVCKSWSSTAHDEMWREISSAHLARIFVARTRLLVSKQADTYALSLSKVHTLINETPSIEVAGFWAELPTLKPRTVICNECAHPIRSYVLASAAPYIQTLVFAHEEGIWDEGWLRDFARDLRALSSTLIDLEIPLLPRPSSLAVLDSISTLNNLKRLKLTWTDDCAPTWQQGSILHSSSVPIPQGRPPTASRQLVQEPGLSSLQDLDIEAPMSIIQAVLSSVNGGTLSRVRITGAPFDSASTISQIFTTLSTAAPNLTHLRYGVSTRWTAASEEWAECVDEWGILPIDQELLTIRDAHLRVLLQLGRLSHLALAFGQEPVIDDDFLGDIASHLPHLVALSIIGRSSSDEMRTAATAHGVGRLSTLSDLCSLQLSFDLSSTSIGSLRPLRFINRLSVCGTAPMDSDSLTLRTLLPNLRKVFIRTSPGDEEALDIRWNDVWDSYPRRPDVEYPVPFAHPTEEGVEQDFFIGAVRDAMALDEKDNDSMEYLHRVVDLEEYYSRFPEARRQLPVAAYNDRE